MKTTLDYDIHLVQEVGISGSILERFSDCCMHLHNGDIESHVTGSNMANIFLLYSAYKNLMSGYMSNSPGDFNGKNSNALSYNKKVHLLNLLCCTHMFWNFAITISWWVICHFFKFRFTIWINYAKAESNRAVLFTWHLVSKLFTTPKLELESPKISLCVLVRNWWK